MAFLNCHCPAQSSYSSGERDKSINIILYKFICTFVSLQDLSHYHTSFTTSPADAVEDQEDVTSPTFTAEDYEDVTSPTSTAEDQDPFFDFDDLDEIKFDDYDVEDVDWPVESWKETIAKKVRKKIGDKLCICLTSIFFFLQQSANSFEHPFFAQEFEDEDWPASGLEEKEEEEEEKKEEKKEEKERPFDYFPEKQIAAGIGIFLAALVTTSLVIGYFCRLKRQYSRKFANEMILASFGSYKSGGNQTHASAVWYA